MYIPKKGDIVTLNFEPSAGKEITKHRPTFVVVRKQLNQHTDFAIVAPITSTKRGIALEVVLSSQGIVLIHQLRPLDVASRGIQFISHTSYVFLGYPVVHLEVESTK